MEFKQKRSAPEEEATGSSLKRGAAIGEEGPSKRSRNEGLGVVQGPSNEVNGEDSFEKQVLDQVEGEEDLQNGNAHPLMNPLVLETIFQYTGTLEEVKRNRLVCRAWMNACEPQWTTLTKTLTLFRNEALPQEAEIPSEELMTLQELREMCHGTSSALEKVVPYRKFKFQSWTFDADLLQIFNALNGPITTDRWCWNVIAPRLIKVLTLENCKFPVRFMPFEECFLKALTNLESLSVINCMTTLDILKSAALARIRAAVLMEEEGLGHSANLEYKHPNLKYVHLNVPKETDQFLQPLSLIPFVKLVASLEEFRIEGLDPRIGAIVLGAIVLHMIVCSLNRGFKKLDLLDFSTKTYGNQASNLFDDMGQVERYRFDNLEEFRYDIGCGPEAEQDLVFIQNNMPVLNKLHLYKPPFSQPFSNFLEGRRIETLTELHLWGNMSSSLEFLNELPNLQVLKWVTSCYEDKFNGFRVTSALEESEQLRTYPLMLKDIISQSEDVNRLDHLTTFELDCGPISETSWKRLGQWMPNLKNLKGVVSRAEHLEIIREQWKQLETLELAHGSKLLGWKLLMQLKFSGSLKAFQWKGCACTRKLFGEGVASGLQEIEKKYGSQLPEKCVFPWNANLEGDEATVCKHDVFEDTLMSKAVNSME